jgi:alpha-beta hydrolase superfamily lysophospholipase
MFTTKLQPTAENQNAKNYFYSLYTQSTGKLMLLALLITLVTSGCKKGDHDGESSDQYLVSATKIGDFTKEQLDARFNDKTSVGYLAALDKYAISVYKIVYKTKFINDSIVEASGCIIIPQNAPAPSMISLEHGDILNFETLAPSYYMPGPSSATTAYNEGSAEASAGFITVLPDYLGYGASKNLFHPPFHSASLATASADMIRAAKEYLHDIHQPWNEKLYLQGYSEGGLANLSLQKYIEENHLPFNLKAASTGGAPAHITKIAQYIFNYPSDPGSVKNYLAVILFYNSFYPQLHRPVSDYLIEPYATDVQNNGLNATINVSLNTILNPVFVNGINTGTDQAFLSALAQNDVFDWKPVAPLRLYHGTADITIPYFNSEDAYNAMVARGAVNVELVPLSGLDHDAAIQPYVLGSVEFFKAHP